MPNAPAAGPCQPFDSSCCVQLLARNDQPATSELGREKNLASPGERAYCEGSSCPVVAAMKYAKDNSLRLLKPKYGGLLWLLAVHSVARPRG